MNYLIRLNALIGHAFYESFPNSKAKNCGNIKEKITLRFSSPESETYHILYHSFFYVCSKFAKEKLESSDLSGFSIKPIKKVIREYLNDENGYFPNYERINDTSWWQLCIDPIEADPDFREWKTELIVSEKALAFLNNHSIFEDVISGKAYGKEYEVLTNRFPFEGDIEDFVLNKMPKHMEHINSMQKKIMKEYRTREGLPPFS